jgi:hypothetical protein
MRPDNTRASGTKLGSLSLHCVTSSKAPSWPAAGWKGKRARGFGPCMLRSCPEVRAHRLRW